MPRKKKFKGKDTKVVGLRVPEDKVDEIKKPLREYADYYIETGNTLKDILKKNAPNDKSVKQENST